jgi:hypothetical protein
LGGILHHQASGAEILSGAECGPGGARQPVSDRRDPQILIRQCTDRRLLRRERKDGKEKYQTVQPELPVPGETGIEGLSFFPNWAKGKVTPSTSSARPDFMNDHAFNDTSSPLALLATRRSGKPRDMIAPGPDAAHLETI